MRVDGFASAVHQVHDALGQLQLVEQCEHLLHRQRHALGRLDDDGVAAGERVRQEPEGDHPGEVERRDDGGDAEGLADHHLVDAAGDVLGVVPLDHRRGPACHLDVLDGPAHLGARFADGLAGFHRDGAREVFDVLVEQRLQLEQILNPLADRNPPPCREGAGRGPRRLLDFSGRRQRRAVELFTGRRVEHRHGFGRGRARPLP